MTTLTVSSVGACLFLFHGVVVCFSWCRSWLAADCNFPKGLTDSFYFIFVF